MSIEVTCRKCGRILRLKGSMAGKSGKCPKCGNLIRVPQLPGIEESVGPTKTAHVEGIKVRGGVKKEEVPVRGIAIAGFERSTVLTRARTAPQATMGLVLAVVGLLVALLPKLPMQLNTPPVVAMAGGLIGALGAALGGWAFMNIRQQPTKVKGMGLAIAGLAVGVLAFGVGLVVFSGGDGSPAAEGTASAGAGVLSGTPGKAVRGDCADQLKKAHKILKSYAGASRGRFPATVTQLIPKYIDDMTPFCCPVAGDGTLQYRYTTGLTTESPPGAPLLYDGEGYHQEGRNVLLVNGKVRWMTDEELEENLEALQALSTTGEGESE